MATSPATRSSPVEAASQPATVSADHVTVSAVQSSQPIATETLARTGDPDNAGIEDRKIERIAISRFVNTEGQTLLHEAARLNRVTFLRYLLDDKNLLDIDINSQDVRRKTALHIAAAENHDTIVNELIHAGARLDIDDDNAFTPLHCAIAEGHFRVTRLLIQAARNSDKEEGEYEKTLLHTAADSHSSDILCLLLDLLPHYINQKDATRRTPLHIAAGNMTMGAVFCTQLLKAGAACHAVANGEGQTALHYAVQFCDGQSARVLLNAGAHINAIDRLGKTPLHYAAETNNENAANVLLEAGADADISDDQGQTPLHYLGNSIINTLSFTYTLLEHGINLEVKDRNQRTPLHYHALHSAEHVRLFIQYGANMDVLDSQHHSLLYSVLNKGIDDQGYTNNAIDTLWELLQADADLDIPVTLNAQINRTVRDMLTIGTNVSVCPYYDQLALRGQIAQGKWHDIRTYLEQRPLPLKNLCRRMIRRFLRAGAGSNSKLLIKNSFSLPVPNAMILFILSRPDEDSGGSNASTDDLTKRDQ